ncbi:MAG: alpha/beta hydrolase, partial [Massilia sp.]
MTVTIALVLYAGVCLALFVFQRALIYFPVERRHGDAASVLRLPVQGATLAVSVRPRAGPKALIYFGGNAEDVSANLAAFSAALPDVAIYLMHYRGYGGSIGAPSERALHADAKVLFDKVHAEHAEITVMGRSLGTGVAVRLASERPAARLILVTPYN